MFFQVGEVFKAEILKPIELVCRKGGCANPFSLLPGECTFKCAKDGNGINHIVLLEDERIGISVDLFNLLLHPHKGAPGRQVVIIG